MSSKLSCHTRPPSVFLQIQCFPLPLPNDWGGGLNWISWLFFFLKNNLKIWFMIWSDNFYYNVISARNLHLFERGGKNKTFDHHLVLYRICRHCLTRLTFVHFLKKKNFFLFFVPLRSLTRSITQPGTASLGGTLAVTWLMRRSISFTSTWVRWPFCCLSLAERGGESVFPTPADHIQYGLTPQKALIIPWQGAAAFFCAAFYFVVFEDLKQKKQTKN